MEAERETETEAERVKVLEGDPARAKDLREAEACGEQPGRPPGMPGPRGPGRGTAALLGNSRCPEEHLRS